MAITKMQEKFLQQQDELRGRINTEDTFDINSIKFIAGVDLAYWQKNDEEYAVCCIVVVDFKSHKIKDRFNLEYKDYDRDPLFYELYECDNFKITLIETNMQ